MINKCKNKSKTECNSMPDECKWCEGKIRKYCKSTNSKLKKANNEKKTCKKISDTRCSPHTGKMDENCALSDKNRCIFIKTVKKENKSKSKSKPVPKPKSDQKNNEENNCKDWIIIKQLGKSGKEGTTYEVKNSKTNEICAMKQFKKNKSVKTFMKEVEMQKLAGPLAPEVKDLCEGPPRLVMEKMNKTLPQLIEEQKGKLTDKQQNNLIKLSSDMDKRNIYHNDPNPLNIMVDINGNFRYIDYGMTILKKKHQTNIKSLKAVFYGGMQGLVTRKYIHGTDIKIINKELTKLGAI